MACKERWLVCQLKFCITLHNNSNMIFVHFILLDLLHLLVVFLVEWGTGCTRLCASSWGVKPRWYRAWDTEVTKRWLKLRHSQGSNQTSEQIPILYSIMSIAMSSYCSAHQRCWRITVEKWVCDGLPWRWQCLVCVSLCHPKTHTLECVLVQVGFRA